uniref:Nucleotidyltransferase domain-containing protein n=1 Tax=Geoglobus ahangari TaxID=113653 RepID=A0A7C3UBL6_9EURY
MTSIKIKNDGKEISCGSYNHCLKNCRIAQEKYGDKLVSVVLFGSVARGMQEMTDIAVILKIQLLKVRLKSGAGIGNANSKHFRPCPLPFRTTSLFSSVKFKYREFDYHSQDD